MSKDTTQYKDELPMNILICGIEIKENYITSLFDDKIKKSSRYISEYKYTEYKYNYGWKFQFFEEGLENNNLDIISKKIQNDFSKMSSSSNKSDLENGFKDIIVCFIEDSLDKAKEVITFFSKMKVIYHTFIIFITTNKKITLKALKDFTDNDLENVFDSRNLDIIYYNNKDNLPISLFSTLFYKSCYFNEVGNELILPNIKLDTDEIEINPKKNHCFNFLIIGKPGTGKSTFINIMNGLKVAKEGTGGGKVTYNICKYTVKKEKDENLILYDTPGFGQNNELQKVENYIKKEIINMKEIKEKFHCVIYMLNYNTARNFEEEEENIINTLLDLNIPFYFVLNYSRKPNEKKKKKRDDKKSILEEEIKIHFPSKCNLIKVISLNLKNDNDDCFGLELLFKDLYNFYEKYKIDLNKLESFTGNIAKTGDFIKNSPFFENMTSKDEIMEGIASRCKKEVIAFSVAAGAVGFIPIPFSDAPLLISIQGSMIIAIAAQFGKSLKKAEVAEILKNLSKSVGVGAVVAGAGKVIGSLIKFIPGIGTAVGGAISASTAAVGTTAIGLAAIAFFTPDFSEKDFFEFIHERAKSYNSTIDRFKEFADIFEKSEDYQYALSSN